MKRDRRGFLTLFAGVCAAPFVSSASPVPRSQANIYNVTLTKDSEQIFPGAYRVWHPFNAPLVSVDVISLDYGLNVPSSDYSYYPLGPNHVCFYLKLDPDFPDRVKIPEAGWRLKLQPFEATSARF